MQAIGVSHSDMLQLNFLRNIKFQTYRDFHADIYPETTGCIAQNNATSWIKGHNASVPKISLDPVKRNKGEEPITVSKHLITHLIMCNCLYIDFNVA